LQFFDEFSQIKISGKFIKKIEKLQYISFM
jgi:hypothetical protein